MTDYAPDFTFRYKVHYLAAGFTHDFTVRGPVDTPDIPTLSETLRVAVGNFFADIESKLFTDFAFIAASYAVANSNVFIPLVAVPTAVTPAGPAVADRSARVRATGSTMAGRGIDGGASRLYFFGYMVNDTAAGDAGGDGVISLANDANLGDASAHASDAFRSSSGSEMVYYPRLTMKVNDRLLRTIRRTISV